MEIKNAHFQFHVSWRKASYGLLKTLALLCNIFVNLLVVVSQ